MTKERVALGLAIVIATLWAGARVMDALVPTYDMPASLHVLMALVGTWLFGVGVVRANGNRRNGAD